MTYKAISIELDADGIALVTINVPGQTMNVWDETLIADFSRFVDDLVENEAVKGAVIASGKTNSFVAGADLRMLEKKDQSLSSSAVEDARLLSRMLRKMETGGHSPEAISKRGAMAKPVACAIEGLALGGGLELALACHYRVVADNPAIQLGLPEVTVGLLPGAGGTQRTPRLIGLQNAAMMITQGKPITPAKALEQGLVHAVVPAGKAVEAAKDWVRANPAVLAPWDKKGFKVPGGAGAMHPAAAQFFTVANAMALAETRGNYPAVKAILSCLFEGTVLPIDKALDIEVDYFVTLQADPTARNMIRSLFVNKQALDKGAARPKGIAPLEINKIAVIGGGLMGSGITYVSVKAGMSVVVLDRSVEDAAKAVAYAQKLVDKDIARGKLTQEQGDAILGRIHPTSSYADLSDVDLVIEAVFEQPNVKADVIRQAEAAIGEHVIFASNTSTIPIEDLARNSIRPDQFIGMHFFSPVERMPLLEIIPHAGSGERALAAAFDYNRRIRKTPIVVKDVRGFFTNQVFPSYIHEAIIMVTEGTQPALIENCARDLGMPIGPLALLDDTTLKLGLDVQQAAQKELGDSYVPTGAEPLFELMVNGIGRAGRRFGAGFYDYGPKGERLELWKGLHDHFPLAATQPTPEQVKQRLLYAQLVPTARCYAEGVVQDPQSADLGAILGWGFPVWTGGPLSYIDTIGIEGFVETCDALTASHGERFSAPALFRKMGAEKARLYA